MPTHSIYIPLIRGLLLMSFILASIVVLLANLINLFAIGNVIHVFFVGTSVIAACLTWRVVYLLREIRLVEEERGRRREGRFVDRDGEDSGDEESG
ncbi:hypothetical protein ONS95_007110 [Cadophora gregata]|uniref:uncharacterized protein n=1 Tax=Cadophora gregata TaxID=51156 RepID=UPI0026DAD769|nr:uncharacterized protein ONS95_007110 [Cadophora gregata]KAK0100657.1 hypothetical protein ONS95_007110 [Cadophora gregata]